MTIYFRSGLLKSAQWMPHRICIRSRKKKEQFFLERCTRNVNNNNNNVAQAPHQFIRAHKIHWPNRASRAYTLNQHARYDNI